MGAVASRSRSSYFTIIPPPKNKPIAASELRIGIHASPDHRASVINHNQGRGREIVLVSLARIEAVQTQVLPLNVGISSNNSRESFSPSGEYVAA